MVEEEIELSKDRLSCKTAEWLVILSRQMRRRWGLETSSQWQPQES